MIPTKLILKKDGDKQSINSYIQKASKIGNLEDKITDGAYFFKESSESMDLKYIPLPFNFDPNTHKNILFL